MHEDDEKWVSAQQPPRVAFPFPVGAELEALEEIVLLIPKAVVGPNENIGEFIKANGEAEIALREDLDAWLVKLQKGHRLVLGRSCQVMILAKDDRPRQVRIRLPG
ncbi:MAG: hypothetical protein L6R28_05835 [Planctomycetes bacterium]|nr:hypothetical protein [Planctomycetota bacterium]